jgi:hypothetical protein
MTEILKLDKNDFIQYSNHLSTDMAMPYIKMCVSSGAKILINIK